MNPILANDDCKCINQLDPPAPCIVCDESICPGDFAIVLTCPQCGEPMHWECVGDHEHAPNQGPLWRRVDAFLDSPIGVPLVWFAVLAVGLVTYGVLLRWFAWLVA